MVKEVVDNVKSKLHKGSDEDLLCFLVPVYRDGEGGRMDKFDTLCTYIKRIVDIAPAVTYTPFSIESICKEVERASEELSGNRLRYARPDQFTEEQQRLADDAANSAYSKKFREMQHAGKFNYEVPFGE